MILTILRIMYLRLRNNPLELLLVFVMPVLFFSIFAMIFSQGIASGTEKPVRLALIIPKATAFTNELWESLQRNSSLVCSLLPEQTDAETPDPAEIDQWVSNLQNSGRCDLILRLPPGFSDASGDNFKVRLITDGQNAMAVAMVTSILQEFYAKKSVQRVADRLEKLRKAQRGRSAIPPGALPAMTMPTGDESKPGEGASTASVANIPAESQVPEDQRLLVDGETPPERKTAADGETLVDIGMWLAGEKELTLAVKSGTPRLLTPEAVFGEPATDLPAGNGPPALITVWDPPRPEANPADQAADNALVLQETAPGSLDSDVSSKIEVVQKGNDIAETVVETKAVQIDVENPQAEQQQNPRIAMYAAGIAVLFLLFACTGHAATLLEEAESGTLDRILVSRAGIAQIILGKWAGIFLMGCLQLTVMFSWAELIFHIQLGKHLAGFAIMMGCTSAATSSFAMLMATLCRSRAQLNAAATVIILSMSAMGGSMIPRFVMSDRMQELGRWTFNAWALDGFQKVFWFQSPLISLQTEVLVLLGSSAVMGILTLIFSGRWRRGL